MFLSSDIPCEPIKKYQNRDSLNEKIEEGNLSETRLLKHKMCNVQQQNICKICSILEGFIRKLILTWHYITMKSLTQRRHNSCIFKEKKFQSIPVFSALYLPICNGSNFGEKEKYSTILI